MNGNTQAQSGSDSKPSNTEAWKDSITSVSSLTCLKLLIVKGSISKLKVLKNGMLQNLFFDSINLTTDCLCLYNFH